MSGSSLRPPAVSPGHRRVGPGLVDEDPPPRVDPPEPLPDGPPRPLRLAVEAVYARYREAYRLL